MLKFFSNNKSLNATKTASTANAQYPITNLDSDFRTKVWRSTSNADNIIFDLGSAENVDSVVIVDNWQNGFGFTACTVEGNATDSWGAPSFSTTLTIDTEFGFALKEFASTQSYRYWRLVFTSTLGYVEVANVFIGTKTEVTTNGIDYSWSFKDNDNKKVDTNRYGQEFIDDINSRKELSNLAYKVANTTELNTLFTVFDEVRTVKPFFLSIGDGTQTILDDDDRARGFYKLSSYPTITNTTSGFYSITMNMRESM